MLGKRSRPAIGKLTGVLRSGILDSKSSPRSPLECKMQSPRGPKNYDQGRVGLAIVVALEKPNNGAANGGEILAKYAICGQFSTRSSPIPVSSCTKNFYNNNNKNHGKYKGELMMEMDEEFTYVTCHGPNKSIKTKVYYESGKICPNLGEFKISPARFVVDSGGSSSGSGFLSSCHLCRKALEGKDIYMYRGEKAFCSTECRERQIGMDERKEGCRSEVSRSGDVVVSSSPCTYTTTTSSRAQIFFSAGIVAVV